MTDAFFSPLGPCLETAGFLFSHDCQRRASMLCPRCDKPICEQHARPSQAQLVCAACAREALQQAPASRQRQGGADDVADPYLYSSYYYDGYGYYRRGAWSQQAHDADDFTEADGQSLRHEGDADFEEDMGGS